MPQVLHASKYLKPTIDALIALGRSGTTDEINQWIIDNLQIPDEILEILHGKSNVPEVVYRFAWAKNILKNLGFIANTSRGVWAIAQGVTDVSIFTESYLAEEYKRMEERRRQEKFEAKLTTPKPPIPPGGGEEEGGERDEEDEEEDLEISWKDQLIQTLQNITPSGFEQLALRLLREAGFALVEVTGRSHDGGIDGRGVLKLNDLIGINVLIQCKRYKESVSASQIRDFRGALEGRSDKGIFFTTGTFTSDAKREAQREGAKLIDLIDGDALAELIKKYRLGIEVKTVEEVTVNHGWFQQFNK